VAKIINPMQEITGLSNSGTTDETGTWNEDVDLTGAPFNVPSDASAVFIYVETDGIAGWYGLRDPANDTARSGFQTDAVATAAGSFIAPVNAGTIDIYTERTQFKFFFCCWIF